MTNVEPVGIQKSDAVAIVLVGIVASLFVAGMVDHLFGVRVLYGPITVAEAVWLGTFILYMGYMVKRWFL